MGLGVVFAVVMVGGGFMALWVFIAEVGVETSGAVTNEELSRIRIWVGLCSFVPLLTMLAAAAASCD